MRRKCMFLGKKMISAVLACALVMVPVTPASAATARATTMKLEKTEGTVTLKTQNGTARKITNGMRLYNGNTLKTAKYSYAYVNLDNTKAVKLDQSSSATLRQSGKQMELLVKSGKIFFNVSKPLTEKEQMNVRTSTMVTGIRGTCGVVEYVNVNKSKLYLIEGQVTLGSGENVTTIQGGQTATVVLQQKQTSGGTEQPGDKPGDTDKPGETGKTDKEMKVMVEKMTEETIPSVALQEIVNNPVLQEKIEKTTELKIEKIEKALEQFEKEEAERKEQEKAEQEKENEKEDTKEPEKKPEENKEQDSGNTYIPSDSGNSGGSGGSSTPPATSQPGTGRTTLRGTVTLENLQAAFQGYAWVQIDKDAILDISGDIVIPGGRNLTLLGEKTIPSSTTIQVGDGMEESTFCVQSGAALSAGNIIIKAGSYASNQGTLNCGNVTIENSTAEGTHFNNKGTMSCGDVAVGSYGTFYNKGRLDCKNVTLKAAANNYLTGILNENTGILTCVNVNSEIKTSVDNLGKFTCENITATGNSAIDEKGNPIFAHFVNKNEFTVKNTLELTDCMYWSNDGTIYGERFTGSAGCKAIIDNNNRIILTDSFKLADSNSDMENYRDWSGGVLISKNPSSGVSQRHLLMTAKDAPDSVVYYYYASNLSENAIMSNNVFMNKNVIENMKLAYEGTSGQVTWNFANNAEIPEGDVVELSGFNAQMNSFELQVRGSLTLSGQTNITGSGSATIRVATGGSLTLAEGNNVATTFDVIENTESGYAIALDGGKLVWNDPNIQIKANSVTNTIQGANADALSDGGAIEWPDGVTASGPVYAQTDDNRCEILYMPKATSYCWSGASASLDSSNPVVYVKASHTGNDTSEQQRITLKFNQSVEFVSCTGAAVEVNPSDETGVLILMVTKPVKQGDSLDLEILVKLDSATDSTTELTLKTEGQWIECITG